MRPKPHYTHANNGKNGAQMPQAKATVRKNLKSKSVPVLSAAGLSLSLAAGTPTAIDASANDMPTGSIPLSHQRLHEEEITDLSLATFHIFEEKDNLLPQRGARLSGGGCGACGGSFYLPPVFGLPPGGPLSGPGRSSEPYATRPRRQFLEEEEAPRSPRIPKNPQVPKSAQAPRKLPAPRNSYQNANRPTESKLDAGTKNSIPNPQAQPIQQTQPVQQTQPIQQVQPVQQVQQIEPALGGQANQSAGEQADPETASPATNAPN